MNCCVKCFESAYLSDIISRNSSTIGICGYCKSEQEELYNPSELILFFKNILNLYEVNTENGTPLEKQLLLDFPNKIFSNKLIVSGNVKQLISDIIEDEISSYRDILNSLVQLKYQKSALEEIVIKPLSLTWYNFTKEIKTVNRFHFENKLDIDKFKSLFKHYERIVPMGKKYYRARICDRKDGFPKEEMGNPPSNLTKSGRANPEGISYLYLANDVKTTLYEVRANLLDLVSVGTFQLNENITVINLNEKTYDIFRLAEAEVLDDLIIHKPFIDKLDEELSKPRRRSDSELDYLPTQYLSELIKSMGYDGIEFRSSLNPEGYNLAIFNPDKFVCTYVKVYDVDEIILDFKAI